MDRNAPTPETAPVQTPTPTPAPTVIGVDALIALCAAPVPITFGFMGQLCTLQGRRLTTAEEEQVRAIENEPLPPVIRGKTPEEDRYDRTDKAYRAAEAKATRDARALTIYLGFPELAAKYPNLKSREEVTAFVESLPFGTAVLDFIAAKILSGETEVAARLNFTSAAASSPS